MDVLVTAASRRRVSVAAVVLVALAAFRCDVDSAVIFESDPSLPVEVRPGIFRLTFHLQADLYPTWVDTATVSYRGHGLAPYDTGLVLLQRSIFGGPATERETKFREQASELNLVPVGVPAVAGDPYLVYWMAAKNNVDVCPIPCPSALAQGLRVVEPVGADSLSGLMGWTLRFDRISNVQGGLNTLVGLRLLPEDVDARERGMNPFGPSFGGALTPFYVSTGTAIYLASGTPSAPALDSLTKGSYPAVSPDGSLLAFTRTTLVDSSTATCTVVFGLGACIQTTVTIAEGARDIWVRDLATGTERSLGAGWAPAFDPTGTRVVVVTAAGFDWIDVASGARTGIPNTAGAHSPAVSPDGRRLAFVATWSGQPDVYFMEVGTP